MFGDKRREGVVRHLARALRRHHDAGRPRHADGVGHLHQALGGETRGDDVLGDVARRVRGGAVDLARVLARERAAAVRAGAAVGVDDDLAAGQATVALRAADDEAAGRVDQELGFLQPLLRQHRLDDVLDHRVDELLLHVLAVAHLGRVLARQHDGVDAVGLAVDVAQRHLALRVRAQERQAAVLAQLRLALDEAVRVVDRRRHQLGRLVAGVAEHQALVAGAGVEVVVARLVDALCDVVGLLVVADHDRATLVVDAVFGVVVADALDRVARDLDVVDVRVGRDLAGEHHEAGVAQGLGGDSRARILLEDRVEDRVGNLVGDLVGVAFGNRFGGEEEVVRHAVLQC